MDYILLFALTIVGALAFMSIYKPQVVHHYNHNFYYQLGTIHDIREAFRAAREANTNVNEDQPQQQQQSQS